MPSSTIYVYVKKKQQILKIFVGETETHQPLQAGFQKLSFPRPRI